MKETGYERPCCSLCWKRPDGSQQINETFLFVNKIQMIGMLLNVVHLQVHKKKNRAKESDAVS